MNKKQTIRLNESQLRQIVKESVKRVLNEDKNHLELEVLSNCYNTLSELTQYIHNSLLRLQDPSVHHLIEFSDEIKELFYKIEDARDFAKHQFVSRTASREEYILQGKSYPY